VSGGRILVVDDEASIREMIEIVLSSAGYEVSTAPHGAAALDVVQRAPPNLILLDMRMPVLDGWGFARVYRQKPGPHAPIVVLTAARDAAARAAEIDADGYLGKPFNVDELLALVGQHAR
jgi:two-component system, chemotaxis family, chemotaxis protein CheY